MASSTLITILALCVLLVACAPAYVACPADAKACPDGSAVGRTGPACEFAECPPANTCGDEVCGQGEGCFALPDQATPTCYTLESVCDIACGTPCTILESYPMQVRC